MDGTSFVALLCTFYYLLQGGDSRLRHSIPNVGKQCFVKGCKGSGSLRKVLLEVSFQSTHALLDIF